MPKKRGAEHGIELQGNLLLIYKRNAQNRLQIDNLNIVVKGLWRLTEDREDSQDFIYKKTWNQDGQIQNDEYLLKEYFWERDINKEMIDSEIGANHKNIVDLADHGLMLSKLFQSQGQYEGFFNYNDTQISERFSLILRKKPEIQLINIGSDR